MKLIAVGNARLGSTRCNRKMVRPFADTTLTELAVKRLARLRNFDGVYFAAYEGELVDIARAHLPKECIIKRTRESAYANQPVTLMLEYLWNLEFEYCMWINPCHVFLKPQTLDEAGSVFKDNLYKSMTSVRKRYSWFYTLEGEPINNPDPQVVSTDKTTPLLEVAHAFHIYQKEHFFKTSSYWNNKKNDPYLYEISDLEAIDIDTETDFMVAEALYKTFGPAW